MWIFENFCPGAQIFFLVRESRERNSHPTLSLYEEQKLLFTKLFITFARRPRASLNRRVRPVVLEHVVVIRGGGVARSARSAMSAIIRVVISSSSSKL